MSASSKKKLRKEQNAALLTEKQQQEQKEAKKLKSYTTIFVVVMALVLVLAVGTIGVTAFNNSGILERSTDALTIGEHTLNNAQLNYFLVDAVNDLYSDWYNRYGESAYLYLQFMMGWDITKPLDEQMFDEETSYADYFTDIAVDNAVSTYSIYDAAVAANHQLTDEEKKAADNALATMDLYSSLYGYNYLKAMYGKGAQEDSFVDYINVTTMAQSYMNAINDGFTYEASDLSAHDAAHPGEFSGYTYNSFTVRSSNFIECTANEDDKDHVHTAEEEAAALAAAKAAADQIVASNAATGEDLDKAISSVEGFDSADTSSAIEDILYSDITNEDIAAWLADSSRTPGELGVIPYETTSTDEEGTETTETIGYFVLLFLEKNDNTEKLVNVRHILMNFGGGSTDETTGETVYSEEEKKAVKDKLIAVQEKWLADGGSEDAFAALVADNTDDGGSKDNGGLYEKVYPGQMVENFNDWCFDEARKTGDYEIIETEYGYHLMFFSGHTDVTYHDYLIENDLREADYEAWYNGIVDSAVYTELDMSRLNRDLKLS